MAAFSLPAAPESERGPVKAWSQPVTIPTYEPLEPDRNPMFLDRRVYQGSTGRVYPLPFIDRIASTKTDRAWQALHIENEFLRVMVLPEIGGRIHIGMDKTAGYDFFYRQNVIKPALVGLAGPWASGGVEFNWPQHHRPATFMPVDVEIESHPDGSRTLWCSDHDPMNRLKGMHGICLHPGRSYIELKVRLYNRTSLPQTFLWWANVAARVHEQYQSFFPPDVQFVADHARRAMSRYPLCEGRYYGVDYGQRAREGVPADQKPRQFVPPGTYAPNDLSWYANIPVPTSYMAIGSQQDFFGGYDHAAQAGLIHVANHHIAPGKKQWTWGNHDFGYAWDRNLTDSDGPYIELMAGVFTDNQPDFSYLMPGETRTFSQFWYPIRDIGPAQKANHDAALSLRIKDGTARIGISATRAFPQAQICLMHNGKPIANWQRELSPSQPFVTDSDLPAGTTPEQLSVAVLNREGTEIIGYAPKSQPLQDLPPAATEPLPPEQIASNDELYITGVHLAQYRHATRDPEIYWHEALRRDPGDSRCNNAVGLRHLQRGEFVAAEACFRAAIARLTQRNANPYDGEPYYNLGLALRYLGRADDAYAAFYKATWNHAWQSPAYQALAEISAARGDWSTALDHTRQSLRTNTDHTQVRNLAVIALRQLNRADEANQLLRETLALDPLDAWARWLAGTFRGDNQLLLDVAYDFARCDQHRDALTVLKSANLQARDGSVPMVLYASAWLAAQLGDIAEAQACQKAAQAASPDYCFPSRLEDMLALQSALTCDPSDPHAACYLGHLLYDRRRRNEAIALWEKSAQLDPSYSVVWRNLGIAYFNDLQRPDAACAAFDRALAANPSDARVLYERDQLRKRLGDAPHHRLADLEKHRSLVNLRDDLSVEFATLLNQVGRHEEALTLLQSRQFQPWEGGEGQALGQYVRTRLSLGRCALAAGDARTAKTHFEHALNPPENLGETRHLLANDSDIHYWLGRACDALKESEAAQRSWQKAANCQGDFQDMSVKNFSEMTCYSALAMHKLGLRQQSRQLLNDLLAYAVQLEKTEAKVDYFATSLPAMLLFVDDLQKRQQIAALTMQGQAQLALGDTSCGRVLLQQILQLDPNHAIAADYLKYFQ